MTKVTPEKAGFSTARLRRLEAVMQHYIDQQQVAGLVTLISRQGKIAQAAGFGLMDVEARRPIQDETIVRIASMTKPITAVATMMLYEAGHFQLDDPISAFIPAFKETKVFAGGSTEKPDLVDQQRPITIRDLLTHTSGMALGAGDVSPIEALWSQGVTQIRQKPGVTLQKAVEELAKLPLTHQPGTAWRYSLSFEVLASLVEVISGQWFDLFLRRQIFDPLGMVDTGYIIPQKKVDRLAALYGAEEDGGLRLIEAAANSPHALYWDYQSGTGWTTGGDMLVSTATDYARFAHMLLNGGQLEGQRLLSPKTVAMMTANHLPPTLRPPELRAGYGHGLGVQVLLDVAQSGVLGSAGEFSGSGGYGTYFWVDPKEALVGLLMLQLHQNPYPIQQQFKTLTYQALIG